MLAELKRIAEQLGQSAAAAPAPVATQHRPPVPRGLTPATTLAERIRRDPPPPGVRRFYNTAFKMPERPRRAH